MSFYTFEQLSKYQTDITRYENIEDCPDDFFTEEEIKELLNVNHVWCGQSFNQTLAKEDFDVLYQQAKLDGKKRFVIDDQNLLDVLKYYNEIISPYCTRKGKVIHLHDEATIDQKNNDKETKKTNRSIIGSLVYRALLAHNKNAKFELKIGYCNRDPKGALKLLQQIVPSFASLDFTNSGKSPEQVAKCEYVWNNIDNVPC